MTFCASIKKNPIDLYIEHWTGNQQQNCNLNAIPLWNFELYLFSSIIYCGLSLSTAIACQYNERNSNEETEREKKDPLKLTIKRWMVWRSLHFSLQNYSFSFFFFIRFNCNECSTLCWHLVIIVGWSVGLVLLLISSSIEYTWSHAWSPRCRLQLNRYIKTIQGYEYSKQFTFSTVVELCHKLKSCCVSVCRFCCYKFSTAIALIRQKLR